MNFLSCNFVDIANEYLNKIKNEIDAENLPFLSVSTDLSSNYSLIEIYKENILRMQIKDILCCYKIIILISIMYVFFF